MTAEELLRRSFVSLEVNGDFSEAVLTMQDHSRLLFCHRVGERWAKSECSELAVSDPNLAEQVLAKIALFRLNAKHLDIQFTDGTRWEAGFSGTRA